MGTRSMNALVVAASHMVSAAAARFLDEALVVRTSDAAVYVWETNISPLHARHGVHDLEEEVAILGWLLSLPVGDYKFFRCGEVDLGERGEWDDHPFRNDPPEALKAVLDDYAAETQPRPTLARLGEVLEGARQDFIDILTECAAALGEINFSSGDDRVLWGFIEDPQGRVRLCGYAVKEHPRGALLEDIPTPVLAQLVEQLKARYQARERR